MTDRPPAGHERAYGADDPLARLLDAAARIAPRPAFRSSLRARLVAAPVAPVTPPPTARVWNWPAVVGAAALLAALLAIAVLPRGGGTPEPATTAGEAPAAPAAQDTTVADDPATPVEVPGLDPGPVVDDAVPPELPPATAGAPAPNVVVDEPSSEGAEGAATGAPIAPVPAIGVPAEPPPPADLGDDPPDPSDDPNPDPTAGTTPDGPPPAPSSPTPPPSPEPRPTATPRPTDPVLP